jgi:ribosomal protein S18 acetylase RimI-like enzyme
MSCNRCNGQAAPAMTAAGVPEHQTSQATWSIIHQHLPRCAGCGRWMNLGNLQCSNAECGLRGERQGEAQDRPLPETLDADQRRDIGMKMCRPDDVEAVRQFIIANGDRHLVSHRVILPQVREEHADSQAFLFYDEAGDLVAVSGIDWTDTSRSFVAVQRECRQQGIGRHVTADLMRRCRERDAPIHFQVGATNAPSIAMMKSCGLRAAGERPLSRGRTALLFGEQSAAQDSPLPEGLPESSVTEGQAERVATERGVIENEL